MNNSYYRETFESIGETLMKKHNEETLDETQNNAHLKNEDEHNRIDNAEKVEDKPPSAFSRIKLRKWWRQQRHGGILLIIGMFTALFMAIPLLYVILRSFTAGTERWMKLLDGRIPGLLWNTLSLTAFVTFFAVFIGVTLAWFVQRTDLPGRRIWSWVLALPLVIPPYVGAVAYLIVLGPRGWIYNFWDKLNITSDYPFDMYTFWGIAFVLTMFTYPYVYLIVSAAMRRINRNYEEVARSQGMGMWQVFWQVNLPLLRPAIGAGAILIALYVISDFGAIAMLRYMTFTSAIYYQMGSYDNLSATVLSVVLIGLTLIILWLEGKMRRRGGYHQSASGAYQTPEPIALGKWKWLVTIFLFGIVVIAVLLPIAVLIYWSVIGIQMDALDSAFWGYALNSLKVSGLAALISMALALPIVYLKSRYPSTLTSTVEKLSYSGYALPGVIVALGIIFMFNQTPLYNTYYLIVIAFVIRFLPQAMQAQEASLSLISPRIDEAAQSLGQPPWKVMFTVILPAILPGILAGGALVFVSSIKELPATLLLRPPGYDTMAIRIWVEASEAMYHMAAPPALLIVLVSAIPLRYMLRNQTTRTKK